MLLFTQKKLILLREENMCKNDEAEMSLMAERGYSSTRSYHMQQIEARLQLKGLVA